MKQNRNNWKYLFYWLVFIGLNGLLNLPSWIGVQLQSDAFLTSSHWSVADIWDLPHKKQLLSLVGDYLLLFLPLLLLRKSPLLTTAYLILASLLYLCLFYYNSYFIGYQQLYSVVPIFQNDWIILKEILPTFLNELSVAKGSYLLVILVVIGGSLGIAISFFQLLKYLSRLQATRSFWLIGGVLLGISSYLSQGLNQRNFVNEENIFPTSGINWIYPNILKSSTLVRSDQLEHLKKRWLYEWYSQKPLLKQPNVYLLFVESYGGVATLTPECRPQFEALATHLADTLAQAGWYSTSNYSKSTVIGGRSWLAMTSALIGAKIENQIQYKGLLEKERNFPHMVDYFNEQGYETVRVSTMSSNDIDTLQMITIPNQFWGFDQRKLHSDIPYTGYVYDYYGGIPDQYTLGHIQENILDTLSTPYFMSFITMSSHGPWTNAPPIVADWRSLDSLQNPYPKGRPTISMSIFQYWDLIAYDLTVLTNFILKHGTENSIFILLGDHNPAGMEWKLHGKFNKWATPIHIISKDPTFVHSFQQHGFTEGMSVDTSQYTIMRHMGLYSLFTRQLLENYGEPKEVLPEYLPWGLKFE